MKMPSFLGSLPPRSFFFCFLLLPLLLLLLLLVAPSSSSSSSNYDKKVTMSIYYESLCPFCADFIVNDLVRLFQTGLISIVDLRMVPWGNAGIKPDGTFDCQHGNDECYLNTIEACAINIYPDVVPFLPMKQFPLYFLLFYNSNLFSLSNFFCSFSNALI